MNNIRHWLAGFALSEAIIPAIILTGILTILINGSIIISLMLSSSKSDMGELYSLSLTRGEFIALCSKEHGALPCLQFAATNNGG